MLLQRDLQCLVLYIVQFFLSSVKLFLSGDVPPRKDKSFRTDPAPFQYWLNNRFDIRKPDFR